MRLVTLRKFIAFSLVFVILCFHYVWLIGIQLWLLLAVFYFALGKFRISSSIIKKFSVFYSCWLTYSVYFLFNVLLMYEGGIAQIILNFILVFLIYIMMTIGLRYDSKSILDVFAVAIIVHFVFSIGQILGADFFLDFSKVAIGKPIVIEELQAYYANEFEKYGRVKGTFHFIHLFSSMIGPLMIFFIINFIETKKSQGRIRRFCYAITILLGITTLLLTLSRSVFLGGIIVFFMYFIFGLKRKVHILKFLVTFLIIGLIVVLLFFPEVLFKLKRLIYIDFEKVSSNDLTRIKSYKEGLRLFFDNPLFGSKFSDYNYFLPIHNVPLRKLAYLGITGFLLYIITLFSMFKIKIEGTQSMKWLLWGFMLVCIFDSLFHTSSIMHKNIFQPALFGLISGMLIKGKPSEE